VVRCPGGEGDDEEAEEDDQAEEAAGCASPSVDVARADEEGEQANQQPAADHQAITRTAQGSEYHGGRE
jgi:hypothetical protein